MSILRLTDDRRKLQPQAYESWKYEKFARAVAATLLKLGLSEVLICLTTCTLRRTR